MAAVAADTVLTLDDVLRARQTIAGKLHRTPTFTSRTLSELTGGSVHLKAECFQRTGSFKPRGVLNKMASLSEEEKARGVISISAGNHAQALAYASSLEGVDALVVMWADASPQKIVAARGYGATVDTEAPGKVEAFARLDELIAETGRTLVHPFDDPVVMAGQGTVGLEILEDVPDADVVLVQVGGGGLVSGIATAVKGIKPDARVIAVEPELSDAMHASLRAGERVTVNPTSIADGLAGPFIGENCLAVCLERVDDSVVVTEEAIEEAFRFLYGRAKIACEAAGAATTAALLSGRVRLEPGETAVAVVSGGNIAPETASAILAGA